MMNFVIPVPVPVSFGIFPKLCDRGGCVNPRSIGKYCIYHTCPKCWGEKSSNETVCANHQVSLHLNLSRCNHINHDLTQCTNFTGGLYPGERPFCAVHTCPKCGCQKRSIDDDCGRHCGVIGFFGFH